MYCVSCGAENLETAFFCRSCGKSFVPGLDEPEQPAPTIALWNPDVAALFSLVFFSVVFGAIIHALNWKRIGDARRAAISWIWALTGFAAAVAGESVHFVPHTSRQLQLAARLPALLVMVLWYFVSARRQSKYVVNTLQRAYVKNAWYIPICVALAVWGASWAVLGLAR